jgi:hypothetical protein
MRILNRELDLSASGAKKSHFVQDGDSTENTGDIISNLGFDDTVEIVIRADKILSTVPQGLHGTLNCKQHFHNHKSQMESVQLARTRVIGVMVTSHPFLSSFRAT